MGQRRVDREWFNPANWEPDQDPDPSDRLAIYPVEPGNESQTDSRVVSDLGGSITIDGSDAIGGSVASAYLLHFALGDTGLGTLDERPMPEKPVGNQDSGGGSPKIGAAGEE